MLPKETITQEDALETLFCKPFEELERVPMSEELTKTLITLFIAEDFEIPQNEKPFLFQLIEKRIEHCFTFTIKENRLILFLCAVSESPGTAVMYLTYLQYWCKKNNTKELTFDIFCKGIFPMGFPKGKDLGKLWNELKVPRAGDSDNLIDYQSAGVSIQF